MNRLGRATSPYLLQHADNPVDWWEWSDAAFAEARQRDVPILLSVGYAACHWCHVMAHESFEHEGIAEAVNRDFVAIKVDREERPDVDAVYMSATQAMTGQGGWPMTVFATPAGEPFFAGTYYPRADFARLLGAVAEAWRDQRDAITRQSAQVVAAITRAQSAGVAASPLDAGVLDAAVASLQSHFDPQYGGFGGAPKFPPHMALQFLLRHARRTGHDGAREMAYATAEQMARGGIYDQLAGGFARYAVDGTWTVPHFEKMLYDNALLLRVYTDLWRLTGDAFAGRVARETAEFIVRDLGTPEGGFASALDADTGGVEGATYAWTPAQLVAVLGDGDGAWAADLFGVTAAGTFEHGTSVLRLARDADALDPEQRDRWQRTRAALKAARDARPQPARDDKVVAEWNGLAITALAWYSRVATATPPADPAGSGGAGADRAPAGADSTAAAADTAADTAAAATDTDTDAADIDIDIAGAVAARAAAIAAGKLLAQRHLVDGRLRRVSRDGVVGAPAGVLADYGCVAEGFQALHELTGDPVWLTRAGQLLDVALDRFGDGAGGFHDTADDAEALVTRPADPTDNATPSGASAACAALVAQTALTGDPRYREAAEAALAKIVPIIEKHARFAGYAASAAEAILSGPLEIAIVGDSEHDRRDLLDTAIRHATSGAVIVAGPPDSAPLLAQRPLLNGRPTAYVCRGFVCDRPVTTPTDLAALLG